MNEQKAAFDPQSGVVWKSLTNLKVVYLLRIVTVNWGDYNSRQVFPTPIPILWRETTLKQKVKLLLFFFWVLLKHHCRKCGQAVCGKCSSKRSSYPVMGFEFQVRMCDSCYDSIKDEEWVFAYLSYCASEMGRASSNTDGLLFVSSQFHKWFLRGFHPGLMT